MGKGRLVDLFIASLLSFTTLTAFLFVFTIFVYVFNERAQRNFMIDKNSETAVPKTDPGGNISDYEIVFDRIRATPAAGDVGLMFCLDISESMGHEINGKPKRDVSIAAMRRIFVQIEQYQVRNPNKTIKVGLCSFSTRCRLVRPMGPFNRQELESALQQLQPRGKTAIGDAMLLALKELMKSGDEIKAIIVMTDGRNNEGIEPDRVVKAIKTNRNNKKLVTAGIDIFLVAFDVGASFFDTVKEAGATVIGAGDQPSLERTMSGLVDEVLLEAQ